MPRTTKSSTPTRWEYLRKNNFWGEPEELNKLGREGWELISVAEDGTFMFKRPLI